MREKASLDIEEGSDVLCQLEAMNQSSGDLLNLKASLIEEQNVNSLIGSLGHLELSEHELRL